MQLNGQKELISHCTQAIKIICYQIIDSNAFQETFCNKIIDLSKLKTRPLRTMSIETIDRLRACY